MRSILKKSFPTVGILGVYAIIYGIWNIWWVPIVVVAVSTVLMCGFYIFIVTVYWTYEYKGQVPLGKYIKKEVFNR